MELFGDYLLKESLGEGPFGLVYLAEHRFVKKTFVLKILPDSLSSNPLFMARFEEKIARIASLQHPHILKIHNVSHAEGKYFLVTDPILDSLGQTIHLERLLELKKNSFSEGEKEALLRQVAYALDYAHEKGVIHGSLKLSNILVTTQEKGAFLLLSDFGIHSLIGEGLYLVKLWEEMARSVSPFSETIPQEMVEKNRRLVRDFAFLAPEQKQCHSSPWDEKIDTFAFGVLSYFVLMNQLPEGAFAPPSRWLVDTRKNWDLFIERCLQPSSSARPQKLVLAMDEFLRTPPEKVALSSQAMEETLERTSTSQMSFEFVEPASLKGHSDLTSLKPTFNPPEIARPEYEENPGAIFQREKLVSHYTPKKIELTEIEPIPSEMVIIPGGTYTQGSADGARDEMPRHPIHLKSFALDIHPVTNEQFVRFLEAMGGEKDQNNNDMIRLRDARIKRSAGKISIESGYGKHPVVGVTWYGALAYAKWVGKRLPSEAEWEAAASGGKESFLYPTGSEMERSLANYFSSDTTAVMSYPPNPFGLYDLAGNVYEWCQDWYAYNYYEVSVNEPHQPQGPQQGVYRVLRGGCWKSLKEDLRSSHRHRNNPGAVNGTYGFRCATDVNPN